MIAEYRENILFFDNCNTVKLANKYGTPLYVLSENDILNKCKELKDDFLNVYENTRVAYACKAFCTLEMCRLLEREGLCMDVVSGGELYTAIKAGFPPEKIEFNGNNKQLEEIEIAVDYGVGRIIVDGLQELSLIEEVCKSKERKVNILYRITPGVENNTHEYITTGKKDSKFGIPLDENVIFPAVEQAIDSDYVNFLGFHFHVGSQLFDNHSHLAALETSLKLVKETKEKYNHIVTELNVGGGFGIAYLKGERRKPFSYFLNPIMKRIEGFSKQLGIPRPTVVIEPGRSLVGEAGITLYTVGSIKDIRGIRKYVSVDGGMTDNIRPALYSAKYEGVVANRAEESSTEKITICGKCCESGDILIKDIKVPRMETGDIFAMFSTGAYGYSMASNYNKNPLPAVVFVKDGKDRLVVKRQSFEHMLANEI